MSVLAWVVFVALAVVCVGLALVSEKRRQRRQESTNPSPPGRGEVMSSKQRKKLSWGYVLGWGLLIIGVIIFGGSEGGDKALCDHHEMHPGDMCVTYEGGVKTGASSYSERIPEPGSRERTSHHGLMVLSIGGLIIIGIFVMARVPPSGTPPPPTHPRG
jgi:hypothetical protein